jgi:hypothetical protein
MEHPRAIYSELTHPSAPSYLEAKNRRHPEEAPLELQSEPSTIPSTTPSPRRLRLRLLPWWARLVPHSIPVLFFHEVMLWIARSHSPAMVPPRDSPSWQYSGRSTVVARSDPIRAVRFKYNDWD